jgi:hypothetical protein
MTKNPDDDYIPMSKRLNPDPDEFDAAVADAQALINQKLPPFRKWTNRAIKDEPLWMDLKMGIGEKPIELLRLDPNSAAHFKRMIPLEDGVGAGAELMLTGFPPVESLLEEETEELFDPKATPPERRKSMDFWSLSRELDHRNGNTEFSDFLDLGNGRSLSIHVKARIEKKQVEHDSVQFMTDCVTGIEIELTHTPALAKDVSAEERRGR